MRVTQVTHGPPGYLDGYVKTLSNELSPIVTSHAAFILHVCRPRVYNKKDNSGHCRSSDDSEVNYGLLPYQHFRPSLAFSNDYLPLSLNVGCSTTSKNFDASKCVNMPNIQSVLLI